MEAIAIINQLSLLKCQSKVSLASCPPLFQFTDKNDIFARYTAGYLAVLECCVLIPFQMYEKCMWMQLPFEKLYFISLSISFRTYC